MGRILMAALSLLLAIGPVYASQDQVLELAATGMLEVGPDGSLLDYDLETDLEPDVAALVDRTVRGWQFEPVLVDGEPVIAATRMRLVLEAVPRGDEYALRVADVALGTPDPADIQPPVYPAAALENDIGARVTLLLQVDAGGRVQDVHVEQVSLSDTAGKRTERFREDFATASRDAALGWTYDMGELIDGEPMAARFRVPVTFAPRGANGWSEREDFIPGPRHPSPWTGTGQSDADPGPLEDGEMQPLDPRVKLRDEVVGTEL